MKHFFPWAAALATGLLGAQLTGCQSHHPVARLGGGYEEFSHASHTFLPGDHPPRISLNHVAADGATTLIWPSLYCENAVVREGVAVFVADKDFLNGGQPSTHPRLFAVRSPGLPVDITEEILWRWAVANGRDLTKTFSRFSLATPGEKDGRLLVHLEFWPGSYLTDADWPETGEVLLDWPEVTRLMNSVQAKGRPQKDPRWHTAYIAEKF